MRTLQTDRLILRPFTPADIEIHRVVFSDPEVCRYYCGRTRTPAETQEWLIHRMWQARNEDELGFLAMVRKPDGQIMGLAALQLMVSLTLRFEEEADTPFNPITVELSYAIGREYQRQGYTKEACRALIDYGFGEMRLARLVNGIAPENTASNAVCRSLGFRQVRNVHPTSPGWVWVLDNERFQPKQIETV